MKFALQINSSPYDSEAGETAFQFSKAAIAAGHEIFRIFFYYDGIYHGLRFAKPPEDECQITRRWSGLANSHGLDLVLCISAAQRRGLLCKDEAQRQQKLDDDLADGFRISGLGQLVEAMMQADRFIVFGK